MNDHDYRSLFSALNQAVDILNQHRTPDPAFVAACDTQALARVIESVVRRSESFDTTAASDEIGACLHGPRQLARARPKQVLTDHEKGGHQARHFRAQSPGKCAALQNTVSG